jgi:hypothetical protein
MSKDMLMQDIELRVSVNCDTDKVVRGATLQGWDFGVSEQADQYFMEGGQLIEDVFMANAIDRLDEARWLMESAELLKEHGFDKVEQALINLEFLWWRLAHARILARHLRSPFVSNYNQFDVYVIKYGSPEDAVLGLIDMAVERYAALDTASKQIGEHFHHNQMVGIAEFIGQLTDMGYNVGPLAKELES